MTSFSGRIGSLGPENLDWKPRYWGLGVVGSRAPLSRSPFFTELESRRNCRPLLTNNIDGTSPTHWARLRLGLNDTLTLYDVRIQYEHVYRDF